MVQLFGKVQVLVQVLGQAQELGQEQVLGTVKLSVQEQVLGKDKQVQGIGKA